MARPTDIAATARGGSHPREEPALPEAGVDSAANRAPTRLEGLYRSHWDELVRYARRTFGPGPPEPEDVAQTAFTHFAALARPHLVANPRAFLYKAARNFGIDQARRAKVRARAAGDGPAIPTADIADEPGVERVIEDRQRLAVLDAAIRAMPVRMRTALILHRFEESSYVEIARHIGVSQTEAKRLVADAVLTCTQALRRARIEI